MSSWPVSSVLGIGGIVLSSLVDRDVVAEGAMSVVAGGVVFVFVG